MANKRISYPAKPCQRCGILFTPTQARHIRCSARCNQPIKRFPKVCLFCQKPYLAEKLKSRFCSQSCAGRSKAWQYPAEERFWQGIDRTGECWIWIRHRHQDGYGLFRVAGKSMKVARYAWELFRGPIPDGLWVLHHCDNPPCCNPEHLFLGTHADNMADMKQKNRGHRPQGEASSFSKLVEAEVVAIRLDPRPAPQIAQSYNVAACTVWDIKARRTWKHI